MKILGLVLLTLLVFGCAQTPERSDADPSQTTSETTAKATKTARVSRLPTVTIDASGGGEVRVRVEIADDDSERARGLMYRTALAENRGMLFVYEVEQKLSFWMKNTHIPLSIAFIDAEGRIVDIQDMEPLDDDPPSYVSAEPARYALEVNQGFFEERGVEVGDRAELPE
ncbi:MAG: DUF192 domain-containing protein [Actinomycetota bacterium]|nr:DUF192 domain-containing protein [Actinomycetota bacterium]